MKKTLLKLVLIPLLFGLTTFGLADRQAYYHSHHPFYVGALLGYGSTDWSDLKSNCNGITQSQCEQLQDSAPTSAGDSGAVWGFTAGYEVQDHFAFEASYMDFPNTTIHFADFNFYPQLNYSGASVVSETYVYELIGKFMVPILGTGIRGFADAGMAVTHRSDILNTFYHVNPTFGVGLDYVFNPHWMVDTEFQYIAGYAKATITPADDYSPFLYTVHVLLAYRF